MEKLLRTVYMEIRPSAGEDPIKIKVVFDMTNLTREQLADWVVNASSARVNFQNKNRPKGRAHLLALAAQGEVLYVLQPCGTKTVTMSAEEMLVAFLGADTANMLIEKFGSAEKAKAAIAANSDILNSIEDEE